MKLFPSEFSDLLNKKGLKILTGTMLQQPLDINVRVVPNIIREDRIEKILKGLDKYMYPFLNNYYSPIPKSWKIETKKNFSDKLGKSLKLKSSLLNNHGANAYKIANDLGLIAMLNSTSYKQIGELILNRQFGTKIGKQIMCYETGGYVSPHTDYLPEYENLKEGYFDVQLMFSNRMVKEQFLIYEGADGYLNNITNISYASAIAVYNLPFWHHTTPLTSKRKEKKIAKRWLILGSFEQYSFGEVHLGGPQKLL